MTEVGPSASDTWLHQSEVEPRKDQLAFEKILFFSFFLVTAVTRLNIRLILKNYGDDGKNLIEKLNISK